jgi:hypothetical protein
MKHKPIEELAEDDLIELWGAIGGTPHLFEYGKDDLKQLLTTGFAEDHGLMLDYYTMAAIVHTLEERCFCNRHSGCTESHEQTDTPSQAREDDK